MKFSRNSATKINYFLNEWIPPFLRDSKFFMYLPFKVLFKEKAEIFITFREKAYLMTNEEYTKAYEDTESVNLLSETDLNKECVSRITKSIVGQRVLEVGCGRGFLSKILSKDYVVTASDIFVTKELATEKSIKFVKAYVEDLPFQDEEFDTVICTHVLEHVRDIGKAIGELRRVASKRIIIVVPKERPYKFGFNLHLTFFPYHFSVINTLRPDVSQVDFVCENEGGDWFYIEDKKV